MSAQTQILPPSTAAELARMPEDSFLYELDEGELIVMAPAGELHGSVQMSLVARLYRHVEKHRLGLLPGLRIPLARIFKPE